MSNLSIDPTQLSLNAAALNAFALSGAQSVTGIQGLQSSPAAQAVDSVGDNDGSVGPASSTQISRPGQLFSKLQQLESQDPAKFKQVLTDVANQLTTAAQSATGTDQQFLTNLADKFTKAASGDLSALQPPQQSTSNPAASAYQQSAQTTLNGAALDPLSQSASGTTAKAHHHHGGHGSHSASTKQTLQNVFQELNSALGVSSTSTSDPTVTASAAQAA